MGVALDSERMTNKRRRAAGRITLAITVAAIIAPGSAAAQTPGDISGVDQYVERVPDAGGGVPTGGGRGDDTARNPPPPLSPAAQRELREHGGTDAPFLEAIATSPDFGAPGGLSRSSGSGARAASDRESLPADGGGTGRGDERRPGEEGSNASGTPGAAEGIPDVSFGEAISSAVGAMADTDGGGGPSPLLLALLAISTALVTTAVWRARRNSA